MTRNVDDVMERNVVSVLQEAPFKEIAGLMSVHRVSALPVVDDTGRVVGVVSEADLIVRDETFGRPHMLEGRAARASRRKVHATAGRDLMTFPPIVVGPDETVAEAAGLMRKHGIKVLPVCDQDQHLLGVISRLDLVREFLREDAEIRSEVAEVLQVEMSIPPEQVGATVENGVVTLEGRVEHRSQVMVIAERLRRIPGTVEVVLPLTWDEDDTQVEMGPLPWVGL